MEVEAVSYIFGSFSRRKSSHAHSNSEPTKDNFEKKILPNQSAFSYRQDVRGKHAHSKSQPETGNLSPKETEDRVLRPRSCNISLNPRPDKSLLSATCPICHHVFLEPRVLDCLHSFCTHCLQDIVEKNREHEVWVPKDNQQNGSSILSFLPTSMSMWSDSSENYFHNISNINQITCPVCQERTPLTRQGVLGLPSDYVVQHRLVLATLNDENTKLLCDLCLGEITAVERCTQCMVNLCTVCSTVHRHHERTAKHELLKLREVRIKGLMRIHRHLMCQVHPEHELVAFCVQCEQTTCPLCISLYHSTHRCSPCGPIAASHSQRLKRLLSKAKGVTAKEQALKRRLSFTKRVVQRRCQKVVEEVEKYMEEYRRVIEEHRRKLLDEVENIRASLLSQLSSFETSLSSRLQGSSTTINFTQNLLEEGSDLELLTFISRLLKKLENLEQPIKITEELKEILKQTSNSEQDGLVDYIPERIVKNLNSEEHSSLKRPNKHISVDFVSFNNETNVIRNSKNLQPIFEEKNVSREETSKPFSGILNQLKNCLDNRENTGLMTQKNSIDSKIHSQNSSVLSLDKLEDSSSPEIPTILEFLPQEAETNSDQIIPVIFGQVKKLTSSSTEDNCCSVSRPHLGRSTLQNMENKIPGKEKKIDGKITGNGCKRKSCSNDKVYEVTI